MARTFNSNMFESADEQAAFEWLTNKARKGFVNPGNFASMIHTACDQFQCDSKNVWAEFCCFMNDLDRGPCLD